MKTTPDSLHSDPPRFLGSDGMQPASSCHHHHPTPEPRKEKAISLEAPP